LIQEVFLETDWDDVQQARAARDTRTSELQAEGLTSSALTCCVLPMGDAFSWRPSRLNRLSGSDHLPGPVRRHGDPGRKSADSPR